MGNCKDFAYAKILYKRMLKLKEEVRFVKSMFANYYREEYADILSVVIVEHNNVVREFTRIQEKLGIPRDMPVPSLDNWNEETPSTVREAKDAKRTK